MSNKENFSGRPIIGHPLMTRVSPMINNPKIAICFTIIWRLKELKNLGLIIIIRFT
ncbi:MAG: hypothetical protein ABDH25_00850 [Dictyoglomaceae bacterium]